MRRGLFIFILVNFLVVTFLVRSVYTLLTLLVEDAADDAIPNSDFPPLNSSIVGARPIIPKIIHQTYKNESIPAIWKNAQQSCMDLHPDYEYKLWTDEKSVEFIAAKYPWFLETFKNYRHSIQRADAIRYFVLSHYGGIYIDLDDGCNRRLDPLLEYPAWLRRTAPTGISNDAMGSVPQHPFFLRVIYSLDTYDRNWFLPYITVMYSTGPLFLSVIWKEYMNEEPLGLSRVRVLMQDAYNRNNWSFFTHHPGSSWHGKDARLIFWMGTHWMLLTVAGFFVAGIVGVCLWSVYRRLLSAGSKFCHRYGSPKRSNSIPPSPRSYSPSRRKLRFSSLFQRTNCKKDDEEYGPSEANYELLGRNA